jgi:predicted transcriptional regulator
VSDRLSPLTDAERDVLKVLWERPAATVREVLDRLPRGPRSAGPRAYTTVQTLLHRLVAKGYAAADKRGAAHVFRAAVSREQLLQQRLTDLADELCEGTASPLLLALVEGRRFSPEEIERFRRLLDDLDDSAGGRPRRGK